MGALDLDVEVDRAPARWDADLGAHPAGLFHCEAWGRYKGHEGRGEALYFRWRERESGRVVASALGVRRPPRASRAGRFAARVAFDAPPATDAVGLDFVGPLRSWGRSTRSVIEISLGSYEAGEWRPGGPPNPSPRWDFVLDPDVDIWDGMASSPRENVRRAKKLELGFGLANDVADVRAFAGLYAESRKRLEAAKGLDTIDVDPERFAGSLNELVSRGCGRLYVASRDSELEAACFFGVFGDSAHYLYNATAAEARASRATPLALFRALEDLRTSGYAHVALGGTAAEAADPNSQDHGLYVFKQRFGGRPVPRTSGTIPIRPRRAKAIDALRSAFRG